MSSLRYNSNGKSGSNGHVVGLEENVDKTTEVNIAGMQEEVAGVSSKSNTCREVKAQECVRSNGSVLLSDGQEGEKGGKVLSLTCYLMGKKGINKTR